MTKEAQRKMAIAARRSLTDEERSRYSAEICRKILTLSELDGVKTVLSYLAAWDEVDLSYVNQTLTVRGVTVAYPVCLERGHMEAYVPESADAVVTGAYGIKSPEPERSRLVSPEEIELVLVPLVAFDAEGNRLGHGAGYYDRYLPRCGNVKCIAPAFEAQRLDKLCTDEQDIKMDMIITELSVY